MNEVKIVRTVGAALSDVEARHIVENAFAAIANAVETRDADAFAQLYTADGVLMTPDGALIQGRAAIKDAIGRFLEAGLIKQEAWLSGLVVADGLIVEQSRTRGTIRTADGTTQAENNCIVTHVLEGEVWRMHQDIWNTTGSAVQGSY
ncbi:YybH family protein [Mycolicibacterium helvum]|uniref:SnoaL-like domain-containing protein n=1 Tax=Mycolicibacterium helvum TaxID=1534349 RepID=A0A7I7T6L7_9MYCO|nr:SgcJ/EcaC family oxidoreductase [Mycolicibacterium helvum]BBY64917.1 hypothetical protein MHEL_31600 [Mycolicibacterium helvum]